MALAIAGLVLSGTLTLVSSVQNSGNNREIAADLLTVGKATQHYISLNRTQLLALTTLNTIGSVEEIRVRDADSGNTTASSLVTSGALPTTFPVQNLNGQSYRILIKRLDDSIAGVGDTDLLVGMVYTYGGTIFSDKEGSLIAGQIGAAGGFVFSDDSSKFNGTQGFWQEPVSDWSGSWAAPTAGHVAISTSMLAIDLPGESGGATKIDDLSDGITYYSPNKSLYIGDGAGSVSATGNNNTAAGFHALENASGSDSVGIGIRAGQSFASKDVYVGYDAGKLNIGSENVVFGSYALDRASTTTRSVAYGQNTLRPSASSSDNTAIGYQSLSSASALSFNRTTAIGRSIGAVAITHTDNTIIGHSTGNLRYLSESVLLGTTQLSGAAASTIPITGNVVIGSNILKANAVSSLTFDYNTIISDVTTCDISTPTASVVKTTILGACSTLSSESEQTYFESSKVLTSGVTQIGTAITAASSVTIGSQAQTGDAASVAIGYLSAPSLVTTRFTSLGYGAGGYAGLNSSVSVGTFSSLGIGGLTSNAYSIQIGSYSGALFAGPAVSRGKNTLLSYRSGYNMTTGQNNILVGNVAGVMSGSNNIVFHQEPTAGILTLTNPSSLLRLTTAIRGDLTSKYVVMGGAGTESVGGSLTGMSLYVPDGGIRATGYYYTSDRGLKKDIKPFVASASLLNRLKPVTYTLKADTTHKPRQGFIAQDVLKILPEAVTNSGSLMGISYGTMSVPLVSLIQDNQRKIDEISAPLPSVSSIEYLLEGTP